MGKQHRSEGELSINSKSSEIFIYGFGLAGKWLSDYLDNNVKAFIDTDKKKCKKWRRNTY